MLARVVRAARFAQLRLDAPVVAARGDRVVLRAGTTVGGGLVVDPRPRAMPTPRASSAARSGEVLIHRSASATADGDLDRSPPSGSKSFAADYERRLDEADPLDPGIPAPTQAWAATVTARLGLERRGAKLYRPGAAGSLGEREEEAAALEARLGLEPVKVDDAGLARFLEAAGPPVRVGDRYAVAPALTSTRARVLVDESKSRSASRSPASATCSACRGRPRSSCSSASTPTASRVASATSACSGEAPCGLADLKAKHVRPVVVAGRVEALACLESRCGSRSA